MKNTRITLMALCLMALAWGGTSCKKEKNGNIPAEGEMMTIGADIDNTGVGDTKTFLCPFADGVKVKWSDGEKFSLFGNGSTSGSEFVIQTGVGDVTGRFLGETPAGGLPYFATYPKEGTFDGANTFTFAVSATVTYEAETDAGTSENFISVQKHNAPMVGCSADGKHLTFHNAMSTILLDLKGGAKVTKIVLTDLSGKNLNGTLTVTVDGDGNITNTTMTGGTNTLTINLGEGVALSKEKYSMFCISVPQGAFAGNAGSKNVKIELYDVTGSVIKTITKGLAAGVAANGAYQIVEDRVRPMFLSGRFTVYAQGVGYRTIYFTRGNLWYDGSEFHFEEEQWIANTSNWNNTHLGHFFWGNDVSTAVRQNAPSSMGGTLFTNLQVQPTDSRRYYPNPNFNVEGQTNKYAVIGFDDYGHLLARTSTTSGASNKLLYGMGTVNGVKGIILLPDDWNAKKTFNYGAKKCNQNVFTVDQWYDMEDDGAVFLPITGVGYGVSSGKITELVTGEYWSAFYSSPMGGAATLWFEDNDEPGTGWCSEEDWLSIRLVYYPQ